MLKLKNSSVTQLEVQILSAMKTQEVVIILVCIN